MSDEQAAGEQFERQAEAVRQMMDSLTDPLGDLLADLAALEEYVRQLARFQLPEQLVSGSPFEALPDEQDLPRESVEGKESDHQQPGWPRAPALSKHPSASEQRPTPEPKRPATGSTRRRQEPRREGPAPVEESVRDPIPILPVGRQRESAKPGSTARERPTSPLLQTDTPPPAASAPPNAPTQKAPEEGASPLRDQAPVPQARKRTPPESERPKAAQREGMELLSQLTEDLLGDRPAGAGPAMRRPARKPGAPQAAQRPAQVARPERAPGTARRPVIQDDWPAPSPTPDRDAGEAPGVNRAPPGPEFEPQKALPGLEQELELEAALSPGQAPVGREAGLQRQQRSPADALDGGSGTPGEIQSLAGLDNGAEVPDSPDAETLAALINEVLVEQARRQGVDLS